jgi:hypothetical protein
MYVHTIDDSHSFPQFNILDRPDYSIASVLYLSQYDNFILLPGNNRNIISNETN